MKKWTSEFEMDPQDTCKNNWVFNMKQDTDGLVIESVEIVATRQGCPGHPKTIEAIVRDMSIDKLDLEALQQTTCMRRKSCGMNLADCVSAIKMAAG